MIYEYSMQRSVSVQLANNGDDCVVILDFSRAGGISASES
jgi:hypothetical protein